MASANDEARRDGNLARAPGVCLAADARDHGGALLARQAALLGRRLRLTPDTARTVAELAFQAERSP